MVCYIHKKGCFFLSFFIDRDAGVPFINRYLRWTHEDMSAVLHYSILHNHQNILIKQNMGHDIKKFIL